MPEGLISYISHRLKMLSITVIIVSAIGLAYFSHPDFSRLRVFGTSVGISECVISLVFFAVLWVVLETDNGIQERKKKEEKQFAEFCKFATKIDGSRELLGKFSRSNLYSSGWEFKHLREELLVFSATVFGKFDIVCPPIPMEFNASEWEACKEEWRIFLDDLYICSKGENLILARQSNKHPVDIFPKSFPELSRPERKQT